MSSHESFFTAEKIVFFGAVTFFILGTCFLFFTKEPAQKTIPPQEELAVGGALVPGENPGHFLAEPIAQKSTQIVPNLHYTVYVVKKGDMVGHIASAHNISQDAIISINKLRNTRALQIGQLLKIPSLDGISYTTKSGDTTQSIAEKYNIDPNLITKVNHLTSDEITENTCLFLPDAKLDRATLQEINGDLFKIPIQSWYYVSSRYGWRNDPFTGKRSFHNGIDLACPRGTPVYAALEGRVTTVGYNASYGNYIIISHHSGYQTLYAHLHTVSVQYGQWVTRSTKIGGVGTTGRSTGDHLHFTIYKYNASINPATLWH